MDIQVDAKSFFTAGAIIKSKVGAVRSFCDAFASLNLSDLDGGESIDRAAVRAAADSIEELSERMSKMIESLCKCDEANQLLYAQIDLGVCEQFGDEPTEAQNQAMYDAIAAVYEEYASISEEHLTAEQKEFLEENEELYYSLKYYESGYEEKSKEIADLKNWLDNNRDNKNYLDEWNEKQKELLALEAQLAPYESLRAYMVEHRLVELNAKEEKAFTKEQMKQWNIELEEARKSGNYDLMLAIREKMNDTQSVKLGSFLSGTGKVVENILVDGLSYVGSAIATIPAAISDIVKGNKDWSDVKDIWNDTYDFVSEDKTNNIRDWFYTNTKVGQKMDENSALDYDGARALELQRSGEDLTESGISLLSIPTGSWVVPVVTSGLNNAGSMAEDLYSKVDEEGNYLYRNTKGNILVAGSGLAGALEAYGSSKAVLAGYGGIKELKNVSLDTFGSFDVKTSIKDVFQYGFKNFGDISKKTLSSIDFHTDAGAMFLGSTVSDVIENDGNINLKDIIKNGARAGLLSYGLNLFGDVVSSYSSSKKAAKFDFEDERLRHVENMGDKIADYYYQGLETGKKSVFVVSFEDHTHIHVGRVADLCARDLEVTNETIKRNIEFKSYLRNLKESQEDTFKKLIKALNDSDFDTIKSLDLDFIKDLDEYELTLLKTQNYFEHLDDFGFNSVDSSKGKKLGYVHDIGMRFEDSVVIHKKPIGYDSDKMKFIFEEEYTVIPSADFFETYSKAHERVMNSGGFGAYDYSNQDFLDAKYWENFLKKHERKGDVFGKLVRKQHSASSQVAISKDFITDPDYDLLVFSSGIHSKSTSGVKNLDSDEQLLDFLDKIKAGEKYAGVDSNIDRYIIYERQPDGTIVRKVDPEIKKTLKTVAQSIRLSDANAPKTGFTQGGHKMTLTKAPSYGKKEANNIVEQFRNFIQSDRGADKASDFIESMANNEAKKVEVFLSNNGNPTENLPVSRFLTNEGDEQFSKRVIAGEQNSTFVGEFSRNGFNVYQYEVFSNRAPACTWLHGIEEKLGEMKTSTGFPNFVEVKLPGNFSKSDIQLYESFVDLARDKYPGIGIKLIY